MATSTIAQLAPSVSDRLQDPTNVFWSLNFEVWAGLAEAISELLLIVGRPTVQYNTQIQLQPNTVWQSIPANVLAITTIQCNGSLLWKSTLRSLDYVQSSWGSSWESDRGPVPLRWASLGLNYFIVHPAPLQPVYVNISAIQYPILTPWPPNGSEPSVFEKNIDQALQLYASSYCRLKETGTDAEEGFALYKRFQQIAQRYTQIQDRRDDLVFSQSFGAPTAPSQVAKR